MIPLLIIAAFQAVLLVMLLLTKKSKSIADYILSGYLFVSALTILFAYLEIINRNLGYPYPWVINISTPLILLLGPMLWLYVKSLTDQYFKYKPKYNFVWVPFAIVLVLLLLNNYLKPESVKISIEQAETYKQNFTFLFIVIVIAISNIGYTSWGLFLVKGYREKIKTYFSQTETIDLKWLQFLLVSALICYSGISTLYILDSIFDLVSYQILQTTGYTIASVFVLALGFFGIKQGNIFANPSIQFDMEKAKQIKAADQDIKKEEQDFVHTLLSTMKEKKYYTDPDITLAKLSELFKVSPEHLSGVINGRLNMNFFDFINHHRVEEFKMQCKKPDNHNLTLISIAYDCGFNSKATFNRVFKREVGCTPSDYFKKTNS